MIDIDSWRRKVWLFLILLTFPAVASAQVVQLHTSTGKGTAVCIGEVENGDQLFVTVRHNFEDGPEGRVIFRNRAYAIDNVEISDDPGTQNDVACFTSQAPTSSLPIYRGSLQSGVELELLGFGSYYDGRSTTGVVRRARLDQLTWVINTDQQVIPAIPAGLWFIAIRQLGSFAPMTMRHQWKLRSSPQ